MEGLSGRHRGDRRGADWADSNHSSTTNSWYNIIECRVCSCLESSTRVMTSIVRSDHTAVVTFPDNINSAQRKSTIQCSFRRKSSSQCSLSNGRTCYLTTASQQQSAQIESSTYRQSLLYSIPHAILGLFYQFNPEQTFTLTNRDTDNTTPEMEGQIQILACWMSSRGWSVEADHIG